MQMTGFYLGGLRGHPIDFAALRLDADRPRESLRRACPEILEKVHPGASVLDEDRLSAVF
jgi:hypothetical protein